MMSFCSQCSFFYKAKPVLRVCGRWQIDSPVRLKALCLSPVRIQHNKQKWNFPQATLLVYFSPDLHSQWNIQNTRGYCSYPGYAVLCLCRSYPPLRQQFLWCGCLRIWAFIEQSSHGSDFHLRMIWSEFERHFIDECLNVLFPVTQTFQLLSVSLIWKENRGYALHLLD